MTLVRTGTGVGGALLLAGLLVGCGGRPNDDAVDGSGRSVRVGDPTYALTQLRRAPEGDAFLLPTSLVEALPNHRLTVQGKETDHTVSFSRALVIGEVTKVAKGAGVVWREDESFTLMGYDDARAATRTVLVSMTVDQMTGAPPPASSTIVFRVLVPPEADPDRFAEGLAGLGRIAVLLDRDPNPIDPTPWRPIIDDKLIAVVGADGSLTLPTLRHGRSFAGDIHTADDLVAAAQEPVTTSTLDLHRVVR